MKNPTGQTSNAGFDVCRLMSATVVERAADTSNGQYPLRVAGTQGPFPLSRWANYDDVGL